MRIAHYPKTHHVPDEPASIPVDPVFLRWLVYELERAFGDDLLIELLKQAYIDGVNGDIGADAPSPSSAFVVYRLLSSEGRVLYVGSTRNFSARLKVHRRNWPDVFADWITETYPDASTMLEAEALAIREEQPPLNRAGVS